MTVAELMFAIVTATSSTSTSTWTTDLRAEETPGFSPLRVVLNLPADVVELAFMPLAPLVTVTEEYQLHHRVFDLITNEEKTLAVVPIVDFFSHSGLGFGAALIQNRPLGSADRLVVSVLARLNADVSAGVSVNRRMPRLNGQELSVSASYSRDHDGYYYGLRGEAPVAQRRLLQTKAIDVRFGIMLLRPDLDWNIHAALAFRHRDLSAGQGNDPPLQPGGPLTLPTGFGKALDYPEATLRIYIDSRDSNGRTNTGVLAALEGSASKDINGAETGALRATGSLSTFIPVLPLDRVLFLHGGLSLATPIGDAGAPLHQLVQLGGSGTLRGYDSARFIDRLGWWATAEYRYNIFEYADTGYGFSAAIFGDLGQIGPNPEAMVGSPLRWSAGIGLRAESDLFLIGRFQLAYSPEGFQITLGLGEVP